MKTQLNHDLLKKLRKQKGWTQESLAEASGIHTRTIQRLECGAAASAHSLNRLASALDVSAEVLQQPELDTGSLPPRSAKKFKANMLRKDRFSIVARTDTTKKKEQFALFQLVAFAILSLGGYLSVSVLIMTQSSLSKETLFNVFFPGIAIGACLMLIGGLMCLKTRRPNKAALAKISGL